MRSILPLAMLAFLLVSFAPTHIVAFQSTLHPMTRASRTLKDPSISYQQNIMTKPSITSDADLPSQTSTRSYRTSLAMIESPLDLAVIFYSDMLDSNPLVTKLVTGGFLAVCGDAIAQSRESGDYDQIRAASFATFDVLYRALQCAIFPIIVLQWHGQYLTQILPWMDMQYAASIEDTMVNQFLVIPLIYYPFFFTLTGTLQGLSPEGIVERARSTVGKLLIRNWAFWLPVQYIQFQYIDEPLQIPFLCLVGLAWTFILSFSAGSMKTADEISQ